MILNVTLNKSKFGKLTLKKFRRVSDILTKNNVIVRYNARILIFFHRYFVL